jgi:hypothetical protein
VYWPENGLLSVESIRTPRKAVEPMWTVALALPASMSLATTSAVVMGMAKPSFPWD